MPKKVESYEEMLNRLEQIVESFEKEDKTLEESMKNYEEGIKLCNKLYKILNDAEGRIQIVTNGDLKDFKEAGDE